MMMVRHTSKLREKILMLVDAVDKFLSKKDEEYRDKISDMDLRTLIELTIGHDKSTVGKYLSILRKFRYIDPINQYMWKWRTTSTVLEDYS